MSSAEIILDEKIQKEIKKPRKYNVIMLNDDQTPTDWVISVLESIFKYTTEDAAETVLKIHVEGSAVVGTYTKEIAEQKSIESVKLSRKNGFPLEVEIEED